MHFAKLGQVYLTLEGMLASKAAASPAWTRCEELALTWALG
jgi:hypothetical protein